MAYLTVSNSIQVLRKIDGRKLEYINGNVYKKSIYFFSKYEKNILLGLQELWKDPDKFLKSYYVPVDTVDNLKYVFEGVQPAYHLDSSCDRLNSNFKNFEVPEELKKRGREEVVKFRKWFKTNMHLLDKPEIFTMRLFHAFNIQVNPKAIDYDNSGVEEKENLSLKQLEERIDEIIRNAGQFWHQNQDKQPIIRRFQKYTFLGYKPEEIYNNYTGLSDEELKDFLRTYDTMFKRPIKDLLIEYYRVKLNPDLQFEGKLLEQLGFRACKTCEGKWGNKIYEDVDKLFQEKNKITPKRIQKFDNNKFLNPGEQKDILNKLGW